MTLTGEHILAIDQGTTGSTALLIDPEGAIRGRAYSEFTQIYPRPGWVEHAPEEIWRVTAGVIRKAIDDSGLKEDAIAAIGVANQRETTVVWDVRTGLPIHNAIVWQCRRTAPLCNELKEKGLEDKFRSRTGLVLDAYFSGTKIAWLLEHVDGARALAKQGRLAFGTIDSWIIWKLTGGKERLTDHTNASRTLVYNISERKWDGELLDILHIPESMLPEVRNSSGEFGAASADIFHRPIPITGVAGDQQAALFGQMCVKPGMVKNTYGTGCFALTILPPAAGGTPLSTSGLLTTLACDDKGGPVFAFEGSVFIGGAAIQWLRDELGLISASAESEEAASRVVDTGGVYLVPAFVGLGAPYWDMDARGVITGITRGTNRYHIVRAALESIAYQSADLINAMAADMDEDISELRVDGGASKNDLLMQFQADILGVPVNRPQAVETTAMGAAFLAGLHVGLWSDAGGLANARRVDRIFKPQMADQRREELLAEWKNAVRRARSGTG